MPDQEESGLYRLEQGFANFTAVPNEVLRSLELSGNAKALYAILIDVAYRRDEPTQQDLGALLGGGIKLARSTLTELHGAGLLEAHRPGQGRRNYYVLMRPKGTSGSDPEAHPSVVLKTKAIHPSGAQTIVAYFVDESTRLHSEPPRRVTGQVAALVSEMLGEGIGADRIRAGIDALLLKRTHPSTLPSLVHEAGLPRRPQPRRDGGVTPSEIMARAVQHAREGL